MRVGGVSNKTYSGTSSTGRMAPAAKRADSWGKGRTRKRRARARRASAAMARHTEMSARVASLATLTAAASVARILEMAKAKEVLVLAAEIL